LTKHVKYGGSTAARTIACPGWHAQSADLPRAPASAYAEEGTALHTVMERLLLGLNYGEDDNEVR